ncbi:hydroxypyruvate isomerase family protein [Ornithinimicrobium tianjinense]|uniref:Hydroxypyruvate isomerase n=1 Tax=Ornithinimicrobium tianjinense TaxID=1195761 RepID=A0A917F195_9MICO|nr:TIM barrel protein [Ornithinimicrobium tianjinense]GGF40380.1 hydroxypyruvate isomerase [Ornithinimicrobium tianjinense]
MTAAVRWVANLSMLFNELPLLERPAAARAAGFEDVEMWWPFDGRAVPRPTEVDRLVEVIVEAGVHLTAMNLFAGFMAQGDRGVLSHPDRAAEFGSCLDTAVTFAQRLGVKLFNAPYGLCLPDLPEDVQARTALRSLGSAATRLDEVGGTVLIEPLSGAPDYPLRSTQDAVEVIESVRRTSGLPNVALLLDQYHLERNGFDPLPDARTLEYVRHVQVAESPSRGEPGSGAGRVAAFVDALLARGYQGAVALEYKPTTTTAESLQTWRRHVSR